MSATILAQRSTPRPGTGSLAEPATISSADCGRSAGVGHALCTALLVLAFASSWPVASRGDHAVWLLPLLPLIAFATGRGTSATLWSGLALVGLALQAALRLTAAGREALGGELDPSIARHALALALTSLVLIVGLAREGQRSRRSRARRDRMRERLARREAQYRRLLEHATEGTLMVAASGRIRYASPAAELLVGLETGAAKDRRLDEFAWPEDLDRVRYEWRRMLAGPGSVVRFEARTLPQTAGGDRRTLRVTLCNTLEDEAVGAVIVHMHDVTERAMAEANYESLVESSLQGLAVECEGRIVYVNPALSELLGVDRLSLLQRRPEDPFEIVHPDDQARIRAAFDGSGTRPTEPIEMRIRRPDGEWRWVQLRWSDAIWQGRSARQISYVDITAQRALALEQRLAQERLEARIAERTHALEESQRHLRQTERLASIGTLAAGIAHEINNPVGSILASADFALLTADEPGGRQIGLDALADIREQAIRCGQIVRSVLQFSRAEPTEKWIGEIGGVLRTTVDCTRRFAEQRRATVVLDIDPTAAVRKLRMNPIELEQVFVNLVRNAIEAQPARARVVLRARVERGGKTLLVSVEDDGPGVPQSARARVFDPFFTTRRSEGGTGLGLSVAHGIVEEHAGRMWLDPPEGSAQRGCCFRIRLPLEDEAVQSPLPLEDEAVQSPLLPERATRRYRESPPSISGGNSSRIARTPFSSSA
ncbi:MAG TPA: PAS domain S-box protein [Myxococcota bacterium]|nr:PAS domain S-box protein [Myxococcota bacterium]